MDGRSPEQEGLLNDEAMSLHDPGRTNNSSATTGVCSDTPESTKVNQVIAGAASVDARVRHAFHLCRTSLVPPSHAV